MSTNQPLPRHEDTLADVLVLFTALEYGTKKEERALLDSVFSSLGVRRRGTAKGTARAIQKGPGFEAFLLAVLKVVRPFALMVREVYTFLNDARATVERRATTFRVRSEGARLHLDFSLDNFPRELLSVLTQTEVVGRVIELRFPGVEPHASVPINWLSTESHTAWRAISPAWDNDFYDDGFFRALSYASSLLPRLESMAWARLEEMATPILDRLAAIVDCLNSVQPVAIREVHWPPGQDGIAFRPVLPATHSHRVHCEEARTYLESPTQTRYVNEARRTVRDELEWTAYSTVIAIHLFHDERAKPRARDEWLARRLPSPLPGDYLGLVKDLAQDYRVRLDRVAPVIEGYQETVLHERLLEFLLLPFWKHRWFLYELWTLVRVLGVATKKGELTLLQLSEARPGVLEWRLPGGTAQGPVALVGSKASGVLCWTQRKTFHPGTGEGLEPDLRLTRTTPLYHDLFLVENKDRRSPPGAEMKEIAQRYVEGTCAEALWLVNYDSFSATLHELESRWPGRRVHVASEFRPGQVSPEFEEELSALLDWHLGTSAPQAQPRPETIEIVLSWMSGPQDLDLYVGILREDGAWSICYRDPGRLDKPPFAQLDQDDTSAPGRETVRVSTRDLRSFSIGVHNYSEEEILVVSEAEVAITFDRTRRVTFKVPRHGLENFWLVAEYDHQKQHLRVIDLLGRKSANSEEHTPPEERSR
jgi:hypothetical protein